MADGLVTLRSAHDFKTTLDRLLQALKAKNITVFATVDHAAGAATVGLALRPTTLVVFGNPAAGTPVMQIEQTAGIDLPLKALVWEDENGATNLSYNDPAWIAARHSVGDRAKTAVSGLTAAIRALAAHATAA
jgi:uncharacterized protein (DUF302 family)